MTLSAWYSISNGRALSNGARPTAGSSQGRSGRSISALPNESNILAIRSRLEPTDWDIVIGPTRHAYFTVRMADGLRVVDGGKIVDADGQQLSSGHQRQLRRMGRYVGDGTAYGHQVGVTVVRHPSPLPTGWYAHEWGTVAVNPFLHQEQSIRQGEALELRRNRCRPRRPGVSRCARQRV